MRPPFLETVLFVCQSHRLRIRRAGKGWVGRVLEIGPYAPCLPPPPIVPFAGTGVYYAIITYSYVLFYKSFIVTYNYASQ